jgi:hypothetical protein
MEWAVFLWKSGVKSLSLIIFFSSYLKLAIIPLPDKQPVFLLIGNQSASWPLPWGHQLPNGIEDHFELGIIFFLQGFKLMCGDGDVGKAPVKTGMV